MIVARQISISDSLKELIHKKLTRFDKFFDDSAEAYVTLRRKKNTEILELTITNGATMFRAEEADKTFQNALDAACDTILGQLRKHKTKLQKRLRSGKFDAGVLSEHWDDPAPEEAPRIRVKTFDVGPMSPEEAILQMELLGHQFFVFENAETGDINVVYQRKDDSYGLIVPSK